jgi:hypothetical protein
MGRRKRGREGSRTLNARRVLLVTTWTVALRGRFLLEVESVSTSSAKEEREEIARRHRCL